MFQYSSVALGITAATAVGIFLDLVGRFTTDSGYVYEGLTALVDVGDDCTVGDVNTDVADFRSDNTVQRPVEAYWVDVTEQIECIRYGVIFFSIIIINTVLRQGQIRLCGLCCY